MQGNAVTAYLFTGKRFMCGEYLCRHRIAPQIESLATTALHEEKMLPAVHAEGLCVFAVLS
jgi:hypothetical protein